MASVFRPADDPGPATVALRETEGGTPYFALGVAEMTCAWVAALERRAPDADASGPLHTATVAAMEHRIPAATIRPLWFLTGTLSP